MESALIQVGSMMINSVIMGYFEAFQRSAAQPETENYL